MAWRRPGDKPLSEPMMVRLPTHICVTRPQWVNKKNAHERNICSDFRYYTFKIASTSCWGHWVNPKFNLTFHCHFETRTFNKMGNILHTMFQVLFFYGKAVYFESLKSVYWGSNWQQVSIDTIWQGVTRPQWVTFCSSWAKLSWTPWGMSIGFVTLEMMLSGILSGFLIFPLKFLSFYIYIFVSENFTDVEFVLP